MEEIVSVALFLASGESSHIVGQSIIVDGGMQAYSWLNDPNSFIKLLH
jgi:NAD(P)-dependent dehydrogenase (short-subunit alcohol dehydrogenase family)